MKLKLIIDILYKDVKNAQLLGYFLNHQELIFLCCPTVTYASHICTSEIHLKQTLRGI